MRDWPGSCSLRRGRDRGAVGQEHDVTHLPSLRPSPPLTLSAAFVLALLAGCPPPGTDVDGGVDADGGEMAPDGGVEPDGCHEGCESMCPAEACGDWENSCGDVIDCGSCLDDATLAALTATVDEAIALYESRSYMHDILDLDIPAIREDALAALEREDEADPALIAGLFSVVRSFKNGHAGIYGATASCFDLGAADLGYTAYGVCAKPYEDDFVVTHQPGLTNPLGLSRGDRIVGLNGDTGADMQEAILSRPLCANGAGNHDVDHEHAAEALFGVLRRGDELLVEDLEGNVRTVVATAPNASVAPCRFPAGPTQAPLVSGELRDDGVAVIRLTRFTLFPGEPGYVSVQTEADAWVLIENMIDQVVEVFDDLEPTAQGIVWDARGNIGGASPVAFEIAAGMPGATETPIARCTTRIAGSDPVDYDVFGPDYDLFPSTTLQTNKPTAVLIDGLSISAGDYFARAVSLATAAPIFGRPSAGAYGGGGQGAYVGAGDRFYMGVDPFRCNDTDGVALETRSVQPDVWVDYEPADLAVGLDTVEEAAAAWVREQ